MVGSAKKVAVLMGGVGEERPVSLQSGRCVSDALRTTHLEVVEADITPDDMIVLDDKSIDVFFLALHGKFGEDGQLQHIMENKSLVYTGSGPQASRIAFDKIATKRAFEKAGVLTAGMIEFTAQTDCASLKDQLIRLGKKYVVKPVRQGSSVGVSIVDDADTAIATARKCLAQFGDCMIEEFIKGTEVTVGILCGKALPIIEIRSKAMFYDYKAKYIDDTTEYLFDTVSDPATVKSVQQAAIAGFNAVGCRDFSRIDFIITQDGRPYALEINTIPGFTTHSLLPKAAAKTGLSMSQLCLSIIEAAAAGSKRK